MLVRHLPRDSALLKELHGEAAEWSLTDHLLANVVDRLAEANWMFAMVNRDEDSEPLDYPEPVPRPGQPSDPGESPHGTSGDSLPSLQEIQRFLS